MNGWLVCPGITTTLVDDLLVEHSVSLDVPDKYGRLAHCSAAINGHLDVVTYLLEECPNSIDINSIDEKFVHAAEDGDRDEIARIIAEINGSFPLRYMRDKYGKNAVHWAAESGHLSTLKLLGEHFAVWTDADQP
ncbi:TPA: LOW QUALITY PROTEIN: hypothetical protein N0F65_002953 [Lagenidium giganteum]|uniref:Ankyrin n=1 Tax=Lagenidium giganteum TaxID=4803 RepID=A0AAV2Z578_9STRA|nr:TPA: LOW QUALITY PROTEIN: hypothetical protein N0F65_002953 [Lagenidium giganteum]